MALRRFSPCSMRVRAFVVLIVWVAVVSLSTADLFDLQDNILLSLADLQQAIELDVKEVLDEATSIRVVIEDLDQSLPLQSTLVRSVGRASDNECVPMHCLLSRLSVYRL